MKNNFIVILTLSLMLCLPGGILIASNSGDEPQAAPLNPEFLKYREAVKSGNYKLITKDGYHLGYVPSPVDLSHVTGVVDKKVQKSYSSRYDLRNHNKVTPVRDQGDCGSCWIFSTYASLESCLKPSESRNFAEEHLNRNHGFDSGYCGGGNFRKSTAYLARWDGPINEIDDPYPHGSENGYVIQKHIQQVVFLPERDGKLDNDTIKYFVTEYGAVSFSYQVVDGCYNPETYSYYFDGSESDKLSDGGTIAGHAVVIVGWDNNFSRYNFNTVPPGNGAFIAKNSWGRDWGDDGYFYISYYDDAMTRFTIFNNAESPNNYKKNYQYDPYGWTRSYGYSNSKTAWGANIFTATGSQTVQAVGFYTTDSNVNYNIYVYKGVQSGKPRSGSLLSQVSGSKLYPGYHTVELTTPVSVIKDDRFSIVIKFVNSSYEYPVPVEHPSYGGASTASASVGQSFIDNDGTGAWYDIAENSQNRNVCIKAFTKRNSSYIPMISCSHSQLNFTYIRGSGGTDSQTFTIENSGTGSLNWSLESNADWIDCTPQTGTDAETVTVSVDAPSLAAGDYTTNIYVIDDNASNSPQTVNVRLSVINSSDTEYPFGEFATPEDYSTVMSSVPVTGWVLDDVGVESVKIYVDFNYIGDAVFVDGARPDIEQAYPQYPNNTRAGWGYMMLTNFLPGGGNGWYILEAVATDKEGHVAYLGYKIIFCDNANAVKPFGAIDTPAQGGVASGIDYRHIGWALTPQPNKIPIDGSTINVWVDGKRIGKPTYNKYRRDIANLFPGYANSNGAVGVFTLDTTKYDNGLHSICWTATDNAGNTDGIGSRFFSIQNSKNARKTTLRQNTSIGIPGNTFSWVVSEMPFDNPGAVEVKKGWNKSNRSQTVYPDDDSVITIKSEELQRLVVRLNATESDFIDDAGWIENFTLESSLLNYNMYTGYLIVGNQLKALPIGSTLDRKNGVFYWQPGPGFVGTYQFIFIKSQESGRFVKQRVTLNIEPCNFQSTTD